MEFLTLILCLGILWILGVCVWAWLKGKPEEGFQIQWNPQSIPVSPIWIRTPLDAKARQGHSCRVLESFVDPEFPTSTIEIVESSCEEGLPHTSDANTIRIPESVWNQGGRRANVLRHERIHLLQKRNPDAWINFYKTAWQYTLHTKLPDGFPDADAVRGNPDTDPPFACWAGRYWFVPLYTNREAPRLGDAKVRVWDAQTKQWVDPPTAWNTLFCQGRCPHQWEHPAEISAEYWTDSESWKTPASVALRNFILTQK